MAKKRTSIYRRHLLLRNRDDMVSFIKQRRKDANQQVSYGPISVTNKIILHDFPTTDLSRNKEDWRSLKYKLTRAKWLKYQTNSNADVNLVHIDRTLKVADEDLLQKRPQTASKKKTNKSSVMQLLMAKVPSSSRKNQAKKTRIGSAKSLALSAASFKSTKQDQIVTQPTRETDRHTKESTKGQD